MKLILLLACLLLVVEATPAARRLEERLAAGRCAAVTLVYSDDEFVLGAATLGHSLRDVHTRMAMVAMVTDAVGADSRKVLLEAGWRLHEAKAVANPNPEYFPRLEYIFTKLQIYTLLEFDRVVYLDADTLVNENVDELCSCNAYHCSVVRNTFFNSGVIVAIPSAPIYADMMARYTSMHSYTGGDQGFLNNYFWNPEECPFFDPHQKLESPLSTDVSHLRCQRLPGYYNGDVGVYITRGDKWQFDADEQRQQPKITHYTLSVFKPWSWPTYIIVRDSWTWFRVFSEHDQRPIILLLVVHLAGVFALVLGQAFVWKRVRVIKEEWLTSVLMLNRMGRALCGQVYHTLIFFSALIYSLLVFVDPNISFAIFLLTYYAMFEVCSVSAWIRWWEVALGQRVVLDRLSVNVYKGVTYVSLLVVAILVWTDLLSVYGRGVAIIAWVFFVPGVAHTVFYQIPPVSMLPK